MEKFSIQKYDELFKAILLLESVEECRGFFEDLCTIKELEDLSQRLAVAKLLSEKKNYNEIIALNSSRSATLIMKNANGKAYTVLNCMGEKISEGVIDSELCEISVPLAGMICAK